MRTLRRLPRVALGISFAALLWVASTAVADSTQRLQDWPRTEYRFDPATQLVTVTMPIENSRGDYIPNVRADNFVVYEEGARQREVTVEIQRAPVALAMLLEHGGRYDTLNEAISGAVSSAAGQLLGHISREDTVAVWAYGDKVREISGFQRGREALQHALQSMKSPFPSESNLYDALSATLTDIWKVGGRKALLLISSGVDTFSKASYADLLQRVRDADVPIYVIDLSNMLQRDVSLHPAASPYARLDWKRASSVLAQIAKASGGRLYVPDSALDLPAMYDDLMESLRARYVIRYHSPKPSSASGPRTVRVELVDSRTGAPLGLADTNGRPVNVNVRVAGSYVPGGATTAG